LTACGGGDSSQKPAAATTSTAKPTVSTASPAPAKTGVQEIGDIFNAWNKLYKANEKVINGYEGMPIMELVTPGATFIGSIQYDMLNLEKKNGRFEERCRWRAIRGLWKGTDRRSPLVPTANWKKTAWPTVQDGDAKWKMAR